MANAPDQGIMALPENDEMARPQLSMEDSYDAIQSALGEVSPQAAQDVYGALRDSISRLPELSPEQVDTALQVLKELYNAEQEGYLRVLQRLIAEGKVSPGDFPEEYDPEFLATAMAVLMEAKKRGGETPQDEVLEPPQGMARGGIAEAVRKASAKGRNGDTMLAHIGPEEAAILRRHGGAGTVNPATGLPEFGFLSDLWKDLKGAVKDVFSSSVGRIIGTVALAFVMGPAALGWTSSTLAAMPFASGAATLLGGGSLKDALKSAAVSYLAGPTGPLGEAMGSVTQAMGITNPALAQFAGSALTGAGATLLTGGKLKDAVQAGLMQGVMASAFSGPRPEGTLAAMETRQPLPGLEGLPQAENLPGAAPTAGAPGTAAVGAPESLIPAPMAPAAPQAPGAVPSPVTPPSEMAFRDLPSLTELPQTAPPAAQGAQPPAGSGFQAASRPGLLGGAAPVEPPYTPGALQQDAAASYKTPTFTESMGRAYDALKTGEIGQAGAAVKEAFMPPMLSDAELMQRPEFQQYKNSGFTAQQALEKTREAVNPGMLRRYGPLVGAGIAAMGAAGGFKRPQATQTPYQKYMSDKLERERAWLQANPGAFYIQNMPGVAYDAQGRPVLGSGMPPPGYRHGGSVQHFEDGGGVGGPNGDTTTTTTTPGTGTTPPVGGVLPPPSVVSAPVLPYAPYPQGSVATPSVGATEQGHQDIFNQQTRYNQAIAKTLGVTAPPMAQMPSVISPYGPPAAQGPIGQVGPPAPGAAMPVQSKVDAYKQLIGYGLTPDQARKFAELTFGPQTDADWAELQRLAGGKPAGPPAGPNTPPINITKPGYIDASPEEKIAYLKKIWTGDRTGADVRKMFESVYGPASEYMWRYFGSKARPDVLGAMPSGIASFVSDMLPEEKAALYNNWKARGLSETEVRAMADQQFGKQPESDWRALQQIASKLPSNLLSALGPVPNTHDVRDAVAAWKASQAMPAPVAPPVAAPAPAPVNAAPAVSAGGMSAGYMAATQPGGIGEEQYYRNIADFILNNPDESIQRQAQQQYGVSDEDVYQAKLRHGLLGPAEDTSYNPYGYAQGGIVPLLPNSSMTSPPPMPAVPLPQQYRQGGYPRRVGQISGPGTEKSDSIPAMLSDGEFVMTAKAVRGAGKGSRREGAKRMYALMHRLERNASKG